MSLKTLDCRSPLKVLQGVNTYTVPSKVLSVSALFIHSDDKEEKAQLKKLLVQKFDKKDLGKLQYFLEIEIVRSEK